MAKAPGKHFRKGMNLIEASKTFSDPKAAEAWFVSRRWPNGICGVYCGSMNVNTGLKNKSMPYRYGETVCRKCFSVRTKAIMAESRIGLEVWVHQPGRSDGSAGRPTGTGRRQQPGGPGALQDHQKRPRCVNLLQHQG